MRTSAITPVVPQRSVAEGIQHETRKTRVERKSTPTTHLEIDVLSPQIGPLIQMYESPNIDLIVRTGLEVEMSSDSDSAQKTESK